MEEQFIVTLCANLMTYLIWGGYHRAMTMTEIRALIEPIFTQEIIGKAMALLANKED